MFALRILVDFDKLENMMGVSMKEVFPDHVLMEWVLTHVAPYAKKLRKVVEDVKNIECSNSDANSMS